MKYLLILAFACISLSSTAQVIDTTMTGNAMHMNLNLTQLDSTIRSMQELIEAQQTTIESLQAGSFDGDYNSLSNLPTIPSKTSDLTNDAGFTTFDGDYNSLSNQLSQKDIVEFAYYLTNANLANANLYGAALNDANLTNANLTYASLTYANLAGANLNGANLTNATLFYANLTNANLTNANLANANLYGAALNDANLTNANLANANTLGVNWYGAYIFGCTGCICNDADNDNYCD